MNLTYQQGRPRMTFVRIYDFDQVPYSYVRIISKPKGKERFDDMLLVYFLLQKTIRLYKSFRLHIFSDVFHLFNDDNLSRYRFYNLWASAYDISSVMP